MVKIWVFMEYTVTREVVGVFVRFSCATSLEPRLFRKHNKKCGCYCYKAGVTITNQIDPE
jgi:hypothetical protein